MWNHLVLCFRECPPNDVQAANLKNHIKYQMLHKMWKQKVKCSHATLDHHTPEIFTRSYWQYSERVEVIWLLYKFLLATYTLVTWVLSFINYNRVVDKDKYFIYLTNWSYCLLTLQCLLSAVIVVHRFLVERRKGHPTVAMTKVPIYYKIYWVMFSTSLPSAIIVSAVFWAVVYDPALHPLDVINVSTHALNSIISVVDFLLVGHPYRLLHFYWTLMYALTYAAFSGIYYLAGGTDIYDRPYIYKILDWRSPDMALATCAGVLVFFCILHLLFWGLQRLKKLIRQKCWVSRARKYAEGQENLGMEHKLPDISTIVV